MPKKLWQKTLLRVPKVGLAYRAYRWFRFTRRYRLVALSREWRQFRKLIEENPAMLAKALTSKTILLGLVLSLWGVIQPFLTAGDFGRESIVSLVTGAALMLLRTLTSQSLLDKAGASGSVLLGAIKSKTIWLGIVASAWGAVQLFLTAGVFTREAIVSLVSGLLIMVVRTITSTALSEK